MALKTYRFVVAAKITVRAESKAAARAAAMRAKEDVPDALAYEDLDGTVRAARATLRDAVAQRT